MKKTNWNAPLKSLLQAAGRRALVPAILAPLALAIAADSPGEPPAPASKPPPPPAKARPAKAPPTVRPKKLSGAELYSIHCNRCHPERYPTERTAAQWKTILLHMEMRANLPAEQARTILKYLQDNSGR